MTEAFSVSSVPAPVSGTAIGIGEDGTYTRAGQVAAFVLGVLTMLAFLPLLVVAAMLYTRAETVFAEDRARARSMVNWSWICIAVPGIPALIGLVVALAYLLSA
ncbi:hypothetical protein OHR68_07790 [Spirillospora sp. NBC_00431]